MTLFSHSLFHCHFGTDLIKNPDDLSWLVLKAANGLNIPDVGYAVVDMAVGGITLPEQGVIVVQDDCMDTERALLGMNILSQCWETIFQTGHPGQQGFPLISFRFCRKSLGEGICCAGAKQAPAQGTAQLPRQAPVAIPPETELLVWGHVPPTMCSVGTLVLVEELSADLDGEREWRVARTISHVRGGKVPVRVCSPHPFWIMLPQRQALAVVSEIESQEVQATVQL